MLTVGLLLVTLTARAQLPMQCAVLPGTAQQTPAPLPPSGNPTVPTNPVNCSEVQNIRVNVHFLQHDDGTGNFGPDDDGRPGNPTTNATGYGYAQVLISTCNDQMNQNPVLNLAPGSSLTPIPKRVRWVLDGVYFDRSSFYRDGAAANGSPSHDYGPLCVRSDSVVNIFLVEEVIWPYNNNGTPVAPPQTRGYVLNSNQVNCDLYPVPDKLWAVVSSPWTKYVLAGTAAWDMAGAVNHELCHLLGLNHPHQYNAFSWGVCPEAPMNANCWNLDSNNPNCDAWSKVSNNLMDYNAAQSSLAPCQIGIIQNNLNTCLRKRFVYKCSDCLPATAKFELAPISDCMPAAIWLDGRMAFNYNWYKLEIDEVTSTGTLVTGTHYETQAYYQAIDRIRLDAVYSFIGNRSYRVKLSTHPSCATVASAVQVRTFTTPPCSRVSDAQRGTPPAVSTATTISFPRK